MVFILFFSFFQKIKLRAAFVNQKFSYYGIMLAGVYYVFSLFYSCVAMDSNGSKQLNPGTMDSNSTSAPSAAGVYFQLFYRLARLVLKSTAQLVVAALE